MAKDKEVDTKTAESKEVTQEVSGVPDAEITTSTETAVENAETVIEPTVEVTVEPAVAIINTPDTEIALKTETVIVFHAKRPLMEHEFDLLSDMIKSENEKTGLKIVLMPFACEVGEA